VSKRFDGQVEPRRGGLFAADRNWSEGSGPQLLDSALAEWSAGHRLGVYSYTATEVRTAVAGHPNASLGDLGYAVMIRFGLIGHSKTTHEWEAVAIRGYLLRRRAHC